MHVLSAIVQNGVYSDYEIRVQLRPSNVVKFSQF